MNLCKHASYRTMIENNQIPVKWVLVMVALTVLAVSSVAAVTPLGERMNALAVTIAGDVVCSQCVGINGDGTNDIKDGSVTNAKIAGSAVTGSKIASSAVTTSKLNGGSVTNAKLADSAVTTSKIATGGVENSDIAANAVTGDKIADGTIGYADVSRSLIAVEHRNDCNCGGNGWDPDGTSNAELIYDDRITSNSVISVTATGSPVLICSTYGATSGSGPGTGFDSPRVVVKCTTTIPDGAGINYAIFKNPAYG